MSEDKAPESTPQGADQPQNLTEALFGQHISQCWVTQATTGDKASWHGHFYKRDRVEAFDPSRGHYFSIALMKPGAKTRSDAEFAGGILIVADDVGHVIPDGVSALTPGAEVDIHDFETFAPETSYENETSHGNFQMGWRISPIETNLARWKHFIEQMKKHPIFGKAFTKCTAVHYVRMETGSNQPKANRARFKTKLRKPYTGLTYTLDELADAFGIDMTLPSGASVPPRQRAMGEQIGVDKVRELLDLLPNDKAAGYGYDTFIKVGMAIYGATGGSPDGLEVYDDWAKQSPLYGVMPGETPDLKWPTFAEAGASASTLRVMIEEKYGVDSPERQKVAQVFATDAFGEIPDEEVEAIVDAKIESKLHELLREISKTQTIPDHHKSGDTAHWAVAGKVQTLRSAATSIVAPPVMLTPYERGLLSVLGGMPGLGKSLLILQQALAVTYDRKDLLRYGTSNLRFAGDVIYISNEDGLGIMKRRFKAWEQRHGLAGVTPPYEVIPLKSTLLHYDGKGWRHECLEILEMILDYVRQGRDIAMIVVDTLATSVTGIDENQAKDINPVMMFLDRLSKAFWASVVFIHHVNKGSVGEEERGIVALKGSFAIGGSVRGAVTLTPASKKEREDFGWEGLEVVAEYVAKANDDKARYVACYYELLTEDIDVGDALDPTVVVAQPTPVLVPLKPVKQINDLKSLRGWFDLIAEAQARGEVMYRYKANSNHVGGRSVHHTLGVSVKKAFEIVDKLVAAGWVSVDTIRDKAANRSFENVTVRADAPVRNTANSGGFSEDSEAI